jgi:hypothetical protein
MPVHISYAKGDFTISKSGLYALDLQVAREEFRKFMVLRRAKQKARDEWGISDHLARRPLEYDVADGWYHRLCFNDEYFFRGMMFVINGRTDCIPETFSTSHYIKVRNGVHIENKNGVTGREPLFTDPGEFTIKIEGYRDIGKKKPTVHNLTQLRGLPKLLEG